MVYPFSKCKACADRLFQKTTKAGQFDISTSMLFLTDPKYHVRIVQGLGNHFPNTMFGGVLLWTLIEVLLRNVRSLYALWRQKTPLTNGQVQEANTHCRKIGEAWLRLGWKSTPWVHWTVAHCGAVLQKYRNLYVFSSIPPTQPYATLASLWMAAPEGFPHVLESG